VDDAEWERFWRERAGIDRVGPHLRARSRVPRTALALLALVVALAATWAATGQGRTWAMATAVTVVDEGRTVLVSAALPEGCWLVGAGARAVAEVDHIVLDLPLTHRDGPVTSGCADGGDLSFPLAGAGDALPPDPPVFQRGCVSGTALHRSTASCGTGFTARIAD
jgi:F0F1-type ATP synthase membrane subunit c/vacuolar-type H+-ATPase subunit K